jgi:hypothetical protein
MPLTPQRTMARGSTALQRPVEPWEDDDDDDVDQEGLTKLMDALGPDGLDDFDKAQLQQLGEDEGDDEEASDHDDDVDEEHTLGLDDDVHDGRALNLDDVSSIDQDAVPRQKIEINDQVRLLSQHLPVNPPHHVFFYPSSPSKGSVQQSNSTPRYPGPRPSQCPTRKPSLWMSTTTSTAN